MLTCSRIAPARCTNEIHAVCPEAKECDAQEKAYAEQDKRWRAFEARVRHEGRWPSEPPSEVQCEECDCEHCKAVRKEKADYDAAYAVIKAEWDEEEKNRKE